MFGLGKKSVDSIVCHDCKHLLLKKDAQEVVILTIHAPDMPRYSWTDTKTVYFCPEHKRSYTKVETHLGSSRYFREVPHHFQQVDPKTGKDINRK